MARYSRRRGALSSFELTTQFATIPGFIITRSFGSGTLLICGHVSVFNGSVILIQAVPRVNIDGVPVGTVRQVVDVAIGETGLVSFNFLEPIAAGVHTLELQCSGGAAGGDHVVEGASELVVIEFPEWDQDDDIISL